MAVGRGGDHTGAEAELDEGGELPIGLLFVAVLRAWRLILSIVVASIFLAIIYLATTKPSYEASALIGPVAANATSSGAKSALAAYTGIDLGGQSSTNFTKYVQVLSSTRLAAALDKKYRLMDEFFPGRDPKTQQWPAPSGPIAFAKGIVKGMLGLPAATPPTPTRLAGILGKAVKVQRLAGDNPLDLKNQISVISLQLGGRGNALRLLTEILTEADNLCRQDQLDNTNRRIAYLKQLIDHTQEVYLRDSLQQVLMNEEQTAVTVEANKYYAFDMIDPPNSDDFPVSPHASTALAGAVVGGLLLSLVLVFILFRRRLAIALETNTDPLAQPFPDPLGIAYAFVRRKQREWRYRPGRSAAE